VQGGDEHTMHAVEDEVRRELGIGDHELPAAATFLDRLGEHRAYARERVRLAEARFVEQQVVQLVVGDREIEERLDEAIQLGGPAPGAAPAYRRVNSLGKAPEVPRPEPREELSLRIEVEVYGSLGDAGCLGNVGHRRRDEAALQE